MMDAEAAMAAGAAAAAGGGGGGGGGNSGSGWAVESEAEEVYGGYTHTLVQYNTEFQFHKTVNFS